MVVRLRMRSRAVGLPSAGRAGRLVILSVMEVPVTLRRRTAPLAFLLLVLLIGPAWSCAKTSDGTLPTTPSVATPPVVPTTTETYTGNLNMNGAASFNFSVVAAGTVTATISTLGPGSAIKVGIALGNWTGTACAIALANDSAGEGATISGSVSGAGNVCVRIYDVGNVPASAPVPYGLSVVHP